MLTHKRAICVSWVDLNNNAYGSVSHMQLQFALNHYHVPPSICELMFKYYECLIGRVYTKNGFQIGLGLKLVYFKAALHHCLFLVSPLFESRCDIS